MTNDQLKVMKARSIYARENCQHDENCSNAVKCLPACIDEIERLLKVVEASKDCDLVDNEPCPCVQRACETCEHNIYPAAVRKALETEL